LQHLFVKVSMIKVISFYSVILIFVSFCNRDKPLYSQSISVEQQLRTPWYPDIGKIPVPAGYQRIAVENNSFGEWLRKLTLRKDSRVYLYNGSLKRNQSAQFAVLDIPVGHKDLQQCADAVLRLRAKYFLDQNEMASIAFKAGDGTPLSFEKWLKGERYKLNGNRLLAYQSAPSIDNKKTQFEQYLEIVFSYCGTYSLDKETKTVNDLSDIQPGDVFVKAGSPGHAMIIVDVAVNPMGEKIFMLAQSYMPAQDIHIVKNPLELGLSPWYRVTSFSSIITPEWTFYQNQLKRWK
jgi:hypothetical protein